MNTPRSSGSRAGTGSGAFSPSSKADPDAGTPSDQYSSTPLQPSVGQEASGGTTESVRTQARDPAAPISSDAREPAMTATTTVKKQASQLAGDLRNKLSEAAEQQKSRGAEAIQGVARAINAAAAELEGQSPLLAQYVRDAAQKVEGLSSNINGRDINELMKAASDLARSQPLLFIGGAVAAGFALSRLLKSRGSPQHQNSATANQWSASSQDRPRHTKAPDFSPV